MRKNLFLSLGIIFVLLGALIPIDANAIPIGEAFNHAMTETSYQITFIGLNLIGVACLVVGLTKHKQTKQASWGIVGVILFVLMFALSMIRPFSLTETTREQADRGVYIGW